MHVSVGTSHTTAPIELDLSSSSDNAIPSRKMGRGVNKLPQCALPPAAASGQSSLASHMNLLASMYDQMNKKRPASTENKPCPRPQKKARQDDSDSESEQRHIVSRADTGKKRARSVSSASNESNSDRLARQAVQISNTPVKSKSISKSALVLSKKAGETMHKGAKVEEAALAKEKKKELQEDNRLVSSRRDTLHEVQLEMSPDLAADPSFLQVLPLLEDLLKGREGALPARCNQGDIYQHLRGVKYIRWERFTHRYYDEEQQAWHRYGDDRLRRYYELFAATLLHVDEIESLLLRGQFSDFLTRVKSRLIPVANGSADPSVTQLFLFVDGLKSYKANGRGSISVEKMENALHLVALQKLALVIPIKDPDDLVRWLHELSMDISYRPYKLRERAHQEGLGIDLSSKQATSKADDYSSTFLAQMQSIHQITIGQAEGICAHFGTWRNLYEAYEAQPNAQARQRMLVGIEMGRKRNGGETDRRIGVGLSSRVYRQLFEEDPEARMDIRYQEM